MTFFKLGSGLVSCILQFLGGFCVLLSLHNEVHAMSIFTSLREGIRRSNLSPYPSLLGDMNV